MRRRTTLFAAVISTCAALLPRAAGAGQVTLDGHAGPAGSVAGPVYRLSPALGRTVGPNLFFSFRDFSLDRGDIAEFSGPSSVRNVLARVTGGNSSEIDGTLRCTIDRVNLYLINPSGIVFGPNAALDVSGSFVATTADYVRLGTDGRFDVKSPEQSVLTSSPPAAFGFLTPSPAGITLNGTRLRGGAGKAVSIVAGPVAMTSAALATQSGRVNIVAAGAAGEVAGDAGDPAATLALAPGQAGAAVSLVSSQIDTAGFGGGAISIRGGSLALSATSSIFSGNLDTPDAGIDIRVQGALSLAASKIFTLAAADAPGGDIHIEAGSLSIDGPNAVIQTQAIAGGAGGAISVKVNGRLTITDQAGESFSGIGTQTGSDARGGDLSVVAKSITVTGANAYIDNDAFSNGGSGSVDVRADAVSIVDGALVGTSSFQTGRGGDVSVSAGQLLVDGGNSASASGIKTISAGVGDVGAITVNADSMTLRSGGVITAFLASGNAGGGAISISGKQMVIDGQGQNVRKTGVLNDLPAGDVPRVGKIDVNVDRLDMSNQGQIAAGVSGVGSRAEVSVKAGAVSLRSNSEITANSIVAIDPGSPPGVSVTAGRLLIEGSGDPNATLVTDISAAKIDGPGRGHDVVIQADRITVTRAGQLTTANLSPVTGSRAGDLRIDAGTFEMKGGFLKTFTGDAGDAGAVTLTAGNITLRGGAVVTSSPINNASPTGDGGDLIIAARHRLLLGTRSFISANSLGSGAGGNVMVDAENVVVKERSSISSGSKRAGLPGDLTLNVRQDLVVQDEARVAAESLFTDAGNVFIRVGHLLALERGVINTKASNAGGNIFIDPQFVVLSDGIINANARNKDGGNITVRAENLITSPGSRITATSQFAASGQITLPTPVLDIAAGLVQLPSAFFDSSARLEDRCAVKDPLSSSFISVGLRGVPREPGGFIPGLELRGPFRPTTNPAQERE